MHSPIPTSGDGPSCEDSFLALFGDGCLYVFWLRRFAVASGAPSQASDSATEDHSARFGDHRSAQ